MKTMPIYIIMSLIGSLPGTSSAQDNCFASPHKGICKTENINLYVGPQSVEPGEDIFIAVETLTGALENSSAKTVTIINADTGRQYVAQVDQGLAYIEIKAPTTSGRIVFTAKANGISSGPAEVMVHAAQAGQFDLMVEKNKGQALLSSSIISDGFGNILDDGRLVEIDLMQGSDVYTNLRTQTLNGRIGLHIDCASIRQANTRLRVRIGEISSDIQMPPYLCGGV